MTVIHPPEPYASDPTQLLALCVWREARGECIEAKLGVVWTVLNRCHTRGQGFQPDIAGNVLKPGAFSSFIDGDPNATKYPCPDDPSWHDSLQVAQAAGISDPTRGAVFYFSPPVTIPPFAWGRVELSAEIGRLKFYRIAGRN